MKFTFYKYQGTGNDFIIIDNRDLLLKNLSKQQVMQWCDRRFGVGADGFMLLEKIEGFDFKMVYYNNDGNESSMCGNGGRCIVAFAQSLRIINNKARFMAIDGEHEAEIKDGIVSLKMNNVNAIEQIANDYYLNTGSPHYVKFVSNLNHYNVFEEGKKVRYNDRFKEVGTNVNFIEKQNDYLFVRTYERGVENETYSCGTGVTAAAIIASENKLSTDNNNCKIKTLGGDLEVKFNKNDKGEYFNIWLKGPAQFVFRGELESNE